MEPSTTASKELSSISTKELDIFSIIERVCSVFSLLGCVFIITTFLSSKYFHKPINRLVFYASFGNLMTNVATLMARTYVGDTNSAGCQFQAFLIQMFMPADAFWTLAMAVNVYLTFYYKFDAQQLRRMEIPYLLCCYGIPFIVALVYIFVSAPNKGRMYGNATLWCWVSSNWDVFRIATFYGPVWIVTVITFFIYARAGREIYKKHKQLKHFAYSSHQEADATRTMDDPYSSSKTTEVFVTSEAVGHGAPVPRAPGAAYSVTISSNKIPAPLNSNVSVKPVPPLPAVKTPRTAPQVARPRRAAYEANNAAWSYSKCAILFFSAMLITWIPSSANRVYSVVHANQASTPLEYMSAFVLPLQGFWNAIIYMVTSWKACQMFAGDIAHAFRRSRGEDHVQELIGVGVYRAPAAGRTEASLKHLRSPGRPHTSHSNDSAFESESMTDLSPTSNWPLPHDYDKSQA